MNRVARLDHAHVWHPFTQMRDWLQRDPIVIVSGKGAVLRDTAGREYLDANSSIWTNLHGHRHPKIDEAIRRQLDRISHSSALGLANEPASLLAAKLIESANRTVPAAGRSGAFSGKRKSRATGALSKVFFSDDGSTAMEVAIKLAHEFARRERGVKRPKFLSLQNAYHGDTLGAASVGHIELFHKSWEGLRFASDVVMAPYCYRCPFNRAKPERADAREYRRCRWECVGKVEEKFASQSRTRQPYAAMVVEPLMQGAAGMIPQPRGWLARVEGIVRGHGAQLIADEVMTGFGRAGEPAIAAEMVPASGEPRGGHKAGAAGCLAVQHEGVRPDFVAVAKGLTGGYLPMAATLTTQEVFDAFLGGYEEFKTFFHGHSYTGNQLGAAAALASLELLESRASQEARRTLENVLREELKSLWALPQVGDIRQVGLMAGVELVRDWRTRAPFDLRERAGMRVTDAMAKRGVLTRPIGNVLVLMPPYCTTPAQARRMVAALRNSVEETFL
ncbi:MAG: adenosylmethionine---8-amino-7-oxononanoate aminotransferase [Verrucomicrobiota bacterium]|jgi:adenosylmethionine-8-amino-7-oxononanoate aminotransferase